MSTTNPGQPEIVFSPRNRYSHEPKQEAYDLIIVGLGVAGFASAMYAARLGLKTLAIGENKGGTLTLTGAVENYPGFVSIPGPLLAELVENHALDYDVDVLVDGVDKIEKGRGESPFVVFSGKKKFRSRAVVFATGATPKHLGVAGERELLGRGVSYCALCDLTQAKGKTVFVVGGGDSAVKEANLLAKYAKKVFIVNNEKKLHAEKPNMSQLKAHAKKGRVVVISNNEVLLVSGRARVEKVILKKPFKTKKEFGAQMVFVYIGNSPLSGLAKSLGVKLNPRNEIIVNDKSETSVPGAYAAGDVTNMDWKQAIIGVAQGVKAAYYANEYILEKKFRD